MAASCSHSNNQDATHLKDSSENPIKAFMARRKRAHALKRTRKRSLYSINEHFERVSNTARTLSAGFQMNPVAEV
jgi:hypothetical protein